jgi:hypothetical protein
MSGAVLGLGGVGIPYFPDLTPCDYWMFAHVNKTSSRKTFESEDGINTAALQ